MSLTGFVNAWEADIEGQDKTAVVWVVLTLAGLVTIVAGAGVVAWGAVGRALRHGLPLAVLVGFGSLGSVILLALATYTILAGLT